jgi:hypothetical protein
LNSTNCDEAKKNYFLLKHTLKTSPELFVELVGGLFALTIRRAMIARVYDSKRIIVVRQVERKVTSEE